MDNGKKLDYPIDILIDDHPDYDDHIHNHPDKILIVRDQPWNLNDVATRHNVFTVADLTGAWAQIKLLKMKGVI